MKIDQQLLKHPKNPAYFLWEQHNITLIKSPNYGYGIAISGGLGSSAQDSCIHISDIVPGGPAENKLNIDDIILSVNGVNVENVEHSFVIRLLKEAKDFIHLVIKRKLLNTQQQQQQQNCVNESQERLQMAIQQTASTVMSNYQQAATSGNNLMSTLMNSTQSISCMKPIKVQLSRKDKKEAFGIVLGCKFYIKDIVPNSIAAQETNLRKGDILLKLNDLSYEQFSLLDANKLIAKYKDSKLNLLIKRDNLNDEIEKEDQEEISGQVEPPVKEEPNIENTTQVFKPIDRSSKFYSNKSPILTYRTVIFARENGPGIRLSGGNKVGIFVSDVQYNSPAERAGLRIKDKLIKVNGMDYSNVTREEAVQHLLSLQGVYEMLVANSPEEFESAQDPLGGDSFYVRAHFSYVSKNGSDLEFRINDILHVTDTLVNGVMGQWSASKLDRNEQGGVEGPRGTVPSQVNAEQMVQTAPTIEQLYSSGKETSGEQTQGSNGFSLGASARMSIRMKLAGKNSLAKRSKSATRSNTDLETGQNIKVTKTNTFYSNKNPAYERVVLKEVNFVRPIVLFGPLADVAREKLKSEFPNKYEIPESYSTDPNDPNSQSSGVIKLASIKSIIEKGKHCLLDITPNAVDHLNYAQYFPICVYLKAQSRAHTKELRQKYAKNLKTKSSKRLYENALKLQNHYSHLFTASIPLDSNQWFKKLKEIIDLQQNERIWISQTLDKLINQQQQQVNNEQTTTTTNQTNPELNNQVTSSNQRYVFDDNFEFPIYTAANPMSMSGAASSTYSLYEENNNLNNDGNRCSFAASDSDLKNIQNESNNPIYSTNFNNKPTNTTNAEPITLTRVKSDPSLVVNQQIQQSIPKNYPQPNQVYQYVAQNNSENENWKKYATYSANSFRNLENSMENCGEVNGIQVRNGHFRTNSNTSSPIKSVNGTPSKVRPCLADANFVNYQMEKQVSDQFRRLSTTSDYLTNQNDSQNSLRNSGTYSSYKLIKNSQSNLMPTSNKAIIDQPILDNNGSLLKPISSSNNDHLDSTVAKQHQLFKQELNNKLNDKLKLEQNDTRQIKSNTNNNSMSNLNNLNSMKQPNMNNNTNNNNNNQNNTQYNDIATLRRKKDMQSPSRPPPPVLPKPKFILPQTTTTNLVLQRNLKSKSELNIATPSPFSSSSPSASSSSSSSSSTHPNEIIIEHEVKVQPPTQQINPLRNKHLENNSIISTSQGYQSDTWESHSSRQSFDMENQFRFAKNCFKPSKEINQPKIAKTTILTSNIIGSAESNNMSDGSMNGMASGSDDTDSIPNDNQNQYFHQAKNTPKQSSSSSTVSTSSSSSSSSGVVLCNNEQQAKKRISNSNPDPIELPIYYYPNGNVNHETLLTSSNSLTKSANTYFYPPQNNPNNNNKYSDLYSNESALLKASTYLAHYNDNGMYRKLSVESYSSCKIVASASGIFDSNGGTLESAETGVSLSVPEGAIANGCSFDLYFKVLVLNGTSTVRDGKGELLTKPIVICGPRGIKFLKPVELTIPQFVYLDGVGWTYRYATSDEITEQDPYNWNISSFHKKTLVNSVIVILESF